VRSVIAAAAGPGQDKPRDTIFSVAERGSFVEAVKEPELTPILLRAKLITSSRREEEESKQQREEIGVSWSVCVPSVPPEAPRL
jgi:hypothetical protein